MNKSEVIKRLNQAESDEAAELLREILRSSVRQALYQLVEEEVKGLCGPKYDRNKSAEYYRAGSAQSEVYLDGIPQSATRPRVRRRTSEGLSFEVHLKTWKTAQDPDAWEDAMMRAILCGVSTRDQQRLHESELRNLSKSAVSRRWQSRSASLVSEMNGRDFSKKPVMALMLDGVHLSDRLCSIIALGIYADGHKEILGFTVGSSENLELASSLVGDLVRRGLHTPEGQRLLCVLDGSDALRKAVLKFFTNAVIQRCLVHKERNIRGYLSTIHWSTLSLLFKDLRNAQGKEQALEKVQAIEYFLADKNKKARDSLEEAGEDLWAFFTLNAPSTLNRTFLSTNCIENTMKNLRRHIGRVCRWRHDSDHPDRWIASGLILAEKGFRKIPAYRDLPLLENALKKEYTQENAA